MKFPMKAWLTAALFAFGGSALAASSASASLSDIRFTLTDLNLNDGIAPSMTLAQVPTNQAAVWSMYTSDLSNLDPGTGLGMQSLDSNLVASSLPLQNTQFIGAATASVTGTGGNQAAPGVSMSDLVATGSAGSFGSYRSSVDLPAQYLAITLAPNTQLSVTANALLNVQTSQGYSLASVANNTGYTPWSDEQARAMALMQFHNQATGSRTGSDVIQQTGAYALASYDPLTGASAYSNEAASLSPLTLTYANTGSQDLQIFFSASTMTNGQGIAAVPEPETYALMLAGMGLVGAVARRRARAG